MVNASASGKRVFGRTALLCSSEAFVSVTHARELPTFGDAPDVPTVRASQVDDERRNAERRDLAGETDRARRGGCPDTVALKAPEDNHRGVVLDPAKRGDCGRRGVALHRLLFGGAGDEAEPSDFSNSKSAATHRLANPAGIVSACDGVLDRGRPKSRHNMFFLPERTAFSRRA